MMLGTLNDSDKCTIAPGIDNLCANKRLRSVVSALLSACSEIADVLRNEAPERGASRAVGSMNSFGDAQLQIDVSSQEIVMRHLRACGAVATVSSEESPVEESLPHDDHSETFAVSFDPLDGSSIVDCNWSVGTIVCTAAGFLVSR